jgi:hypothetical protein
VRLFPISILLFSWVWLKEIDANGRMLLHLDQTLIERIKETDANDPYPKQSKASYEDRCSAIFPKLVDCMYGIRY